MEHFKNPDAKWLLPSLLSHLQLGPSHTAVNLKRHLQIIRVDAAVNSVLLSDSLFYIVAYLTPKALGQVTANYRGLKSVESLLVRATVWRICAVVWFVLGRKFADTLS